jgi:hypothetical protein
VQVERLARELADLPVGRVRRVFDALAKVDEHAARYALTQLTEAVHACHVERMKATLDEAPDVVGGLE